MSAAIKQPAGGAGVGRDGNHSSNSNYNIQREINDVNLPSWMLEKLSRLAAKQDIFQCEQEEITILAHAIHAFPELAGILHANFIEKIEKQKPRELDPIERAAIVIEAYDWMLIVDCYKAATIEEKFRAKLEALAFALREGGI